MADKKRARSNNSADAQPLPVSVTRDMTLSRARQSNERHKQNMEQGIADKGKLKGRVSQCRPGLEKANHRAGQNKWFRQVKTIIRTGYCCGVGPVIADEG